MPSIKVKTFRGEEKTLEVDLSMSVLALKQQLETEFDMKVDTQRVIFSSRVLDDASTLTASGIKENDTLHVVSIARRAEPATPAAQPTSNASQGSLFASDPAPTMGALPGGGGGGGAMPPQIQEFMRSARGQQMMQQIMRNPQMLRDLMQNDPQIAALLQNPEFLRQLRDDPGALLGGGGGGGGGGGMPGFAAPAWPAIPRDIFDIAMGCMNGDPVPERFSLASMQAREGAARQEYITREQVNAALDSALQLTQGASGIASDTGAGAAVAESSGAMDTTAESETTDSPVVATDDASSTAANNSMDSTTDAPAATDDTSSTAANTSMDSTPAATDTPATDTPATDPPADAMETQTPTATQPPSTVSPESMAQLAAMGFSNEMQNRQALEAAGGDIMTAISFLTGM